MDRNSLLAVGLSMLVFTTWIMWKSSQAPPEALEPVSVPEASTPHSPSFKSTEGMTEVAPAAGREQAISRDQPVAVAVPAAAAMDGVDVWTRTVDTETASITLDNLGGAVSAWTLHDFEEHLEDGSVPVQLVEQDWPDAALDTPFHELGLGDLSQVRWAVEAEGPDSVTFAYHNRGVVVRKTYAFDALGYGFSLAISVENSGTDNISPRFQLEWPARVRAGQDFVEQSLAAVSDGSIEREPVASIGSPGFFGALLGGGDDGPIRDVEWAGIDTKYFLAAVVPDRTRDATLEFQPLVQGESGVWVMAFEPTVVPPGQSLVHELRGFVGPKMRSELSAVNASLELSVNRGYEWLAPLTLFFEWFLHAIYTVFPNYGIAIILLTLLVRIVTIPIMGKQMKSMERMRAVQPQLKALQEKHGDDRQKQSEEMMALYKREGVNPLGGCLPMLLQFPVFIGLFYALQSSFDLRQAGFFGWITDLSAPESLFVIPGIDIPFRVLPLIMGASMVLQQKLTPTTVDPAQARMMMTMMPIMFTVLFYQFPSGLVLYWMVSNLLGIGHQLWVGRQMRSA